MFYLIKKEFLIQKKIILFSLFYVIIAGITFDAIFPGGGAIYIVAPVIITYMLMMNSGDNDEKNNSEIIINSLPIKRDDVVVAKYLSIFFFACFGLLSSTVIGIITKILGFSLVGRLIYINDVVAVFVIVMLFSMVYYPLNFKFGVKKMRLINIVMFMLPTFLPGIIVSMVKEHPESTIVRRIISSIGNTPSWVLQTLALVVCAILFLISLLLSMKIYRNKDL